MSGIAGPAVRFDGGSISNVSNFASTLSTTQIVDKDWAPVYGGLALSLIHI